VDLRGPTFKRREGKGKRGGEKGKGGEGKGEGKVNPPSKNSGHSFGSNHHSSLQLHLVH